MKKPEYEVIRISSTEIIMATGGGCPTNNPYCEGNCAPVQGQCTECLNDCVPLD